MKARWILLSGGDLCPEPLDAFHFRFGPGEWEWIFVRDIARLDAAKATSHMPELDACDDVECVLEASFFQPSAIPSRLGLIESCVRHWGTS